MAAKGAKISFADSGSTVAQGRCRRAVGRIKRDVRRVDGVKRALAFVECTRQGNALGQLMSRFNGDGWALFCSLVRAFNAFFFAKFFDARLEADV